MINLFTLMDSNNSWMYTVMLIISIVTCRVRAMYGVTGRPTQEKLSILFFVCSYFVSVVENLFANKHGDFMASYLSDL